MSTFNGIGTLHYGWIHHPDETAHATKWFVVAFFPVIPIRREHLRIIEAPSDAPAWQSQFEILDRVPLSLGNVLKTYFKAYVLVPIILFAPVLLFNFLKVLRPDLLSDLDSKAAPLNVLGPLYVLLYCPIIVAMILDRAKGRRK